METSYAGTACRSGRSTAAMNLQQPPCHRVRSDADLFMQLDSAAELEAVATLHPDRGKSGVDRAVPEETAEHGIKSSTTGEPLLHADHVRIAREFVAEHFPGEPGEIKQVNNANA